MRGTCPEAEASRATVNRGKAFRHQGATHRSLNSGVFEYPGGMGLGYLPIALYLVGARRHPILRNIICLAT